MLNEIVITNLVKQKSITFQRGYAPFVIDKIDWSQPEIEAETYKIPLQTGELLAGVSVGTRTITLTGYVIADLTNVDVLGISWNRYMEIQEELITENKLNLDSLINIEENVEIRAGDYWITGRPLHSPTYSPEENENNEVLCQFEAEILCPMPLFSGAVKRYAMHGVNNMFHFPLEYTARNEENPIIFGEIVHAPATVQNNGENKTGMKITIEILTKNITEFRIYNVVTNEYIGLKGLQVNIGDIIEINTNIGEETIDRRIPSLGESYPILSNLEHGSTFFKVAQGASIYFTNLDEKVDVNISIEFTERYHNIRRM